MKELLVKVFNKLYKNELMRPYLETGNLYVNEETHMIELKNNKGELIFSVCLETAKLM